MTSKGLREKAACPECGCGLIDGLTPDAYREKQELLKKGEAVTFTCPSCGKTHELKDIDLDEEA